MTPELLPAWAEIVIYPPLATLGLWLSLTVGLLRLNQRGPRAGRWALLASLPLLALAHHELHAAGGDVSTLGAYRSFAAGLLVWAWHELAFYSGVLSGPRPAACPPEARGAGRLAYALGTHLYHELACVAELALLAGLLADARNLVGLLAFGLCWALQQSAKLNVLFGVRALQVELFPPHLAYLGSYWARRPASGFFLPSVSVATLLAAMLWSAAAAHAAEPAGVRLALLAGLLTLGALEHWLLVAPPIGRKRAVPQSLAE